MEAQIRYLSDYRSPLPFPSESYAAGGDELRDDLHTWLATARFRRFAVADALKGSEHFYRHMPEDNMVFGGTVTQENGHPLKTGTVVAYNTANNLVYNADINEQGQFRIAVDDFAEGDEFYVEAADKKGRHGKYTYDMADDVFPDVAPQTLHRAEWQALEIAGEAPSGRHSQWKAGRFDLPEVAVTARTKRQKRVPTNKFYATHYIDREEIEKKDYHSLYEILTRMQGIEIQFGNAEQGRKVKIRSTRGQSLIRGDASVKVILDGMRIEDDEDMPFGGELTNLMEMPAFEIESVELLSPWQTNAYISGAINGALYIKTRNARKPEQVQTKGIYYRPVGLSHAGMAKTAPPACVAHQAGQHFLMVDEITADGVKSRVYLINVAESTR